MYRRHTVCFRDVTVNILRKGDSKDNNNKIRPKFTLEQSMKGPEGVRGIAPLFL
jgi:hypothetical protein